MQKKGVYYPFEDCTVRKCKKKTKQNKRREEKKKMDIEETLMMANS